MILRMSNQLLRRLASFPLVLAVACSAWFAAPTAASAATGVGPDFGPDTVLSQLHGTISQRGMATTLHWALPGRYRTQQFIDLDPTDEHTVIDVNRGTTLLGSGFPSALRSVMVNRNTGGVRPDGYDSLDGDLMSVAWPLIARVRSGGTALTPVTSGGRQYLRGVSSLAANECAGLRKGVRTVLLDARTLVPARVIERRAGVVERDLRFTARRARPTDFAPLHIIGARQVHDDGFVRRSPQAAAALLPFPVSLPTGLPAGFTLVQAGSAKRGGMIGPEASFPRSSGLFFAQWRRGLEPIDFTIRSGHGLLVQDWDESDPFAGECSAAKLEATQVGSVTGHYSVGEDGSPRLWWRAGSTLYTLSGPFSAAQLAAMAESLAPIG